MSYYTTKALAIVCFVYLCTGYTFYTWARHFKKRYRPLVTILTSVYDGDLFIEYFLADITRQTIFRRCELILINGNSPGHEERIIRRYMAKYPNIMYKKLTYDPGNVGCWNIGILMSRAEFLINANIDDRMAPNLIETHVQELIKNPDIDLVYSDSYLTTIPNETFERNSATFLYPLGEPLPEFSKEAMRISLPACHPLWRKSMHKRFGSFDANFKALGDHEMWLRAVRGGSKFKKIHGIYGLYYTNPKGASTSGYIMVGTELKPDPNASGEILRRRERIECESRIIAQKYPEFFQ